MKSITACTLFLFIVTSLFAQPLTSKIDLYEFPNDTGAEKYVSLTMPYAKSMVLSIQGDTMLLKSAGDIMIDIVCTDFPSRLSLSQLNKERLNEFYKRFSFINPKQVRAVRVLRQLNGTVKDNAVEMFHGVVARFRPPQTKETMLHDMEKLDELLKRSEKVIASNIKKDTLLIETLMKPGEEVVALTDTLDKDVTETPATSPAFIHSSMLMIPTGKKSSNVRRRTDYYSYIIEGGTHKDLYKRYHYDSICVLIISPKDALKQGYISKAEYRGTKEETGWKEYDSITILHCKPEFTVDKMTAKFRKELDSMPVPVFYGSTDLPSLPDSTVFKILNRNRWKNIDIVGDVTGSMYPYTAQLLIWLKLQSLDSLTNNYSFFNDGDWKDESEKKLGETGGIYSKVCTSYSDVSKLVKQAMTNGGGGDCPENNIEALIHAEKKYPASPFHVLIADNWASIKDKKIIAQLTKPVRIVLCGVRYGAINTDYLDLARTTGGSVHIMDEDLINLAAMHEGEVLNVEGKEFKIVNGHFVDVSATAQPVQ